MSGKRTDYISWDEYFMGIASLSGMRSKDPHTQVGACIVSPANKILSMGYNGFPSGVSDDDFPWNRDGGPSSMFPSSPAMSARKPLFSAASGKSSTTATSTQKRLRSSRRSACWTRRASTTANTFTPAENWKSKYRKSGSRRAPFGRPARAFPFLRKQKGHRGNRAIPIFINSAVQISVQALLSVKIDKKRGIQKSIVVILHKAWLSKTARKQGQGNTLNGFTGRKEKEEILTDQAVTGWGSYDRRYHSGRQSC